MGDSPANDAANDTDWAQQWIEQQRTLLDQAAQSAPAKARFEQVNVLASQWTELGKSYLGGLMQLTQSMGVAADDGAGAQPHSQAAGAASRQSSSPPPGEMFDTWKAAWSNAMSQAASPGGWTDLLNRTPPLGLFREQTEAWRAVAAARADMERLEQELAAVLRRVQSEALVLLAERVKARAGSDDPVRGFRELYDLWVECSEQVFSTVAHSSAYAHLQGELGNASMRLRARIQKVIEQGLKQFDLPTRSELNSLHQQVRLLKQKLAALEQGAGEPVTTAKAEPAAPRTKPAPKSAPKPARRASPKRKTPAATRQARKRTR
jgi:class III poly(R)-hydroxyalkanoic acid synthase PhaE subunit